jgi:hypothetical protein
VNATDEIVAFLRAQLDDVEALAKAELEWPGMNEYDDETYNSPQQMLRDVEAKREIVDECIRTLEYEDTGHWLAEFVLKLLALPFEGRPGWREEWKP